MDSRAVIARFEAERNALAIMNHVNIAKVLDAGTTVQGHPFFAMELVSGIPITDYCDQKKLTVHQRLELFTHVCAAIQHAHQKGVIHRDIKPTNVLVTEQDGKPIAKVIDFGIAKAVGQNLTDRTVYTGFQTVIGTPLYMSPEQAALSNVDVDTRSDVYSLGVLLYELLTGATPFDAELLQSAAQEEVLRIIREQDPPKPSTKVSTLGERASSISEGRRTDIAGLARTIRGDLDWIVMKALERDRGRRYESASAFGTDIQRYLSDEPVEAHPPSTSYRVRKVLQRNRGLVAAVTSVAVVLMGGIVGTTGFAIWARTAQRRAEAEAQRSTELLQQLKVETREKIRMSSDLLEAVKREAAAAALEGDAAGARTCLAFLRDLNENEYEYLKGLIEGLIAFSDGQFEKAREHAELALSGTLRRDASQQVAARSLHALAIFNVGDSAGYTRECSLLSNLDPQTETDHLLMALALMLFEPLRSASLLDATPAGSRSGIGLLIRGSVHSFIGSDEQNTSRIDDAIREFDCSRLLMRKETIGYGWQLHSIASGLEISRFQGRDDDVARYLQAGRALVQQAAPDDVSTHTGRFQFYRAAGETDKATEAIQQIGHCSTYAVMLLAADCLRRFDEPAAIAAFDKAVDDRVSDTLPVQLARVFLLPELNEDAERSIAKALANDSSFEGLMALCALCRTAPPEEVHRRAREFARRMQRIPYSDNLSFRNMTSIELLVDGDIQKCLDSVGESALAKSQAHFTFGMLRLAYNDKCGASEHFSLSAQTNAVGTYGYEWARAFKERMDKKHGCPTVAIEDKLPPTSSE